MESENGVPIDKTGLEIVEELVSDVKEQEENVVSDVLIEKTVNEVEEGLESSKVVVESSVIDSEAKNVSSKKVANGVVSKGSKVVKDNHNSKGPGTFARAARPSLSQSLSFPAKGRRGDAMKTSVDAYPGKSRVNGSKPEATFLNGTTASASRLQPANRRASVVENLKDVSKTNGVASNRRATLASLPSVQQSRSGKVNGNVHAPPSEDSSISADQNLKPPSALPIKEDDDAHSSTSSQRRSSAPGFAFRLDERAEKRKEFFSKLEEKIHAKEMEKTDLQAKSKESQEAEIKQLRKSLTFKAAPMPSFYKEPPPKVELKKIPTTRPISPKLGRNKSSTAVPVETLEGGGSVLSPRVKRDQIVSSKVYAANRDKETAVSKKPVRKSLSKTASKEPVPSKTNGKQEKEKENPIQVETQEEKACVTQSEETQAQPLCPATPLEAEDWIDVEAEQNVAKENGTVSSFAIPDTAPAQVTVEG